MSYEWTQEKMRTKRGRMLDLGINRKPAGNIEGICGIIVEGE